MKIIQNKISGRCMWDGEPVYCQSCKKETSSTFTLPTGLGVCESCAAAYQDSAEYQPLHCSNCMVIPKSLVSNDEGEGLLCYQCDEVLYGAISPEDAFDFAMKPFGGRLKLPPPRPDEELTPTELEIRKTVRAMVGGRAMIGVQPMTKPIGLIFAMRSRIKPDLS